MPLAATETQAALEIPASQVSLVAPVLCAASQRRLHVDLARPARPDPRVRQDLPEIPETMAAPVVLEATGSQVSPVHVVPRATPDPLVPTDLPETPALLRRAPPLCLATPGHRATLAPMVPPDLPAPTAPTASPVAPDLRDHPGSLARTATPAAMAMPDLLALLAQLASVVSARSIALLTAAFSSRTAAANSKTRPPKIQITDW